MDANGTFFHLLLGRNDWSNCLDLRGLPLLQSWDNNSRIAAASESRTANQSGLDWDSKRNEVTLNQKLFQFPATPSDRRPFLRERRGAARDRYCNWYWIDETRREIVVNPSGTQVSCHFC